MVPEARLESTEHGLAAKGDGWFVLNARDANWRHAEGRGAYCQFEGEPEFSQLGIGLFTLEPAEPMAMYHWETESEAFLVVSGEALLIVEGQERPLRQWDFVHCPPKTEHAIIGAGDGPCILLAMSSRENQAYGPYGKYIASEVARNHRASPKETAQDDAEWEAEIPSSEPASYGDGWLPD